MTDFLKRLKRKFKDWINSIQTPKSLNTAVKRCKKFPLRVIGWLDLIQLAKSRIGEHDRLLVESHKLNRDGVVLSYAPELQSKLGSMLLAASRRLQVDNVADIVTQVVGELVRWKTVIQCRDTHATGNYFADAEIHMAWQWENIIFPIIKDSDFTEVLEIAPGHGRNTEYLYRLSLKIHLVDVNESCVEACRERFGVRKDRCEFFYHLTNGNSLKSIADSTITFAYSFDSMVHFDKLVVEDYVKEISRVLRPKGTAFLHHSNFGAFRPNSDWAHNTGTRSDMTAGLMLAYAKACGLLVDFQRLSGRADGWGIDDLDCLTVLRKPGRETADD